MFHGVSMALLNPRKAKGKPRAYNGITNEFISQHWQSKKEHSETRVTMIAATKKESVKKASITPAHKQECSEAVFLPLAFCD